MTADGGFDGGAVEGGEAVVAPVGIVEGKTVVLRLDEEIRLLASRFLLEGLAAEEV